MMKRFANKAEKIKWIKAKEQEMKSGELSEKEIKELIEIYTSDYDYNKYENINLRHGYNLKQIKKTFYSYLDDEDFDSLDIFLCGFIHYPMMYFESTFISVVYYAYKSCTDRVNDLENLIEDAMDDYEDDDIHDFLEEKLDEIEDAKDEMANVSELCESIEEDALDEEENIETKEEYIFKIWSKHIHEGDEDKIKEIIDALKTIFLHYQIFNLKNALEDLFFECYGKHIKNASVKDGIDIVNDFYWACVSSKVFLEEFFKGVDLEQELEEQIHDALNHILTTAVSLNKIIEQKNENDELLEMTKKKREEMLELQRKTEKKQKRQAAVKNVINIFEALTSGGAQSDKLDLTAEAREISDCLMRRSGYPLGHGARNEYTNKINRIKTTIRAKINSATKEQLKNIILPWSTMLESETGISQHEWNLHIHTALQAVLDL